MIKKFAFSFIFVLLTVNTSNANKVLVDITVELSNIAITEDKSPEPSKRSESTYSFSSWGLLYVNDSKQSLYNFSFPYEEMNKYADKLTGKYKGGRRIKIRYKIVNYQPIKAIFSNINKGYHLFDFAWSTEMLLFKYRKKNGEWIKGHYRPEHRYSESPSFVTISGYGDFPVLMPSGYQYVLGKPLSIFNVKEVIRNTNYSIINYEYPVEKGLHIGLNDDELIGKILTLSGKAVLGDSAIRTERSPFWYPWDKYSLTFRYTSYYPSEVTMNFKKIEDLDLSTDRDFEFIVEANKAEERTVYLCRSSWLKNIICNIILALSPLVLNLLNMLRWRLEAKWWMRLTTYIIILIATWHALPEPLNVPRLNFLNVATGFIFLFFIFFLEVVPFIKRMTGGGGLKQAME